MVLAKILVLVALGRTWPLRRDRVVYGRGGGVLHLPNAYDAHGLLACEAKRIRGGKGAEFGPLSLLP